MSYHKRNLPHWNPGDAALFVTWRLRGSLPAPPPEWERLPAGHRFVTEDKALDKLATGPHYLKNPVIAATVAKSIQYGAGTLHLYDLHAWVITSNHVHILIDPQVPLSQLTQSIKTFSAREANKILKRTGQPFWAVESYDHWVRDRKEFENIVRYIELNPVTAGLVTNPEDWRWSSACAGQEARASEVET
jgi:REP element-mobilizing transposase RayT